MHPIDPLLTFFTFTFKKQTLCLYVRQLGRFSVSEFGRLPAGCRGAVVIGIACHAGDQGSIPLGVACHKALLTLFYFFKKKPVRLPDM